MAEGNREKVFRDTVFEWLRDTFDKKLTDGECNRLYYMFGGSDSMGWEIITENYERWLNGLVGATPHDIEIYEGLQEEVDKILEARKRQEAAGQVKRKRSKKNYKKRSKKRSKKSYKNRYKKRSKKSYKKRSKKR